MRVEVLRGKEATRDHEWQMIQQKNGALILKIFESNPFRVSTFQGYTA